MSCDIYSVAFPPTRNKQLWKFKSINRNSMLKEITFSLPLRSGGHINFWIYAISFERYLVYKHYHLSRHGVFDIFVGGSQLF